MTQSGGGGGGGGWNGSSPQTDKSQETKTNATRRDDEQLLVRPYPMCRKEREITKTYVHVVFRQRSERERLQPFHGPSRWSIRAKQSEHLSICRGDTLDLLESISTIDSRQPDR